MSDETEYHYVRPAPKNRPELLNDLTELIWSWSFNAPSQFRPNQLLTLEPTAQFHQAVKMGENNNLTFTHPVSEGLAATVIDFLVANGLISEANFRDRPR